MRLVRIGTAAVSVKAGAFSENLRRLRAVVSAAREDGVHLLVTPELCISGYSLEDRIFWADIAKYSWQYLNEFAGGCRGISVFTGLPVRINAMMHNAAAFIHDGRVRGLILKKYLPTYSIFYEGRNWTAWRGGVTEVNGVPAGDLVFRLPWGMVTAEICEDLWSANSPARARVAAGAEIICNPSASPFTPRKNEERKRLVLGAAASQKAVYAYANILGCDSSRLVFDGGGLIAAPDSLISEGPLLSMKAWTLASGVVDLDQIARIRSENTTWREDVSDGDRSGAIQIIETGGGYVPAPVTDWAAQMPSSFYTAPPAAEREDRDPALDELFDALTLGLRDYFEKAGAFERFLVGLSGGRDSALCLLIAVAAAKAVREGEDAENFADRVRTVYLPHDQYSSSATEAAARGLAKELGVPYKVVGISEEADVALRKAAEMAGGEENIAPMARQNLQARIRGAMMLNWANSAGGLLLVTSNLSEAAVGYTTTGGDNEGGYSPIANVPKTMVTRLLEYLARRDGIRALKEVLAIPPSAELAPDQRDETDLMPYVVLDDLLYLHARMRYSLAECWRIILRRHPDHDPEALRAWTADFGRRFVANQWKRDQHPVSMKVMDLDLDPKTGFRFPVSQSIDYELEELEIADPDEA
jgi:NAD+ synthase (glutamine-hydrolysing)